jgi:hypothetical protein
MWGAFSDERTGLLFVRVTVSSNTRKCVVSMYNLHFTWLLSQMRPGSTLQVMWSLRILAYVRLNISINHMTPPFILSRLEFSVSSHYCSISSSATVLNTKLQRNSQTARATMRELPPLLGYRRFSKGLRPSRSPDLSPPDISSRATLTPLPTARTHTM